MIHASCRFLETISQSLYSAPWTWPKRKGFLFRSPPSPSRNLVSLYTNMPFKMPWLSATTANHCKLPLSVLVVQSSPLSMLFHALRVASLPFDIMKLGTWQLIYSQRQKLLLCIHILRRGSIIPSSIFTPHASPSFSKYHYCIALHRPNTRTSAHLHSSFPVKLWTVIRTYIPPHPSDF